MLPYPIWATSSSLLPIGDPTSPSPSLPSYPTFSSPAPLFTPTFRSCISLDISWPFFWSGFLLKGITCICSSAILSVSQWQHCSSPAVEPLLYLSCHINFFFCQLFVSTVHLASMLYMLSLKITGLSNHLPTKACIMQVNIKKLQTFFAGPVFCELHLPSFN